MSESERLCSKLLNRLKDIGSAAVALSGGVDSCFLAYAASRVECGNFAAYYVQSAFQPEFELTDALQAAKEADRKSTRLNSSHNVASRMPSSA